MIKMRNLFVIIVVFAIFASEALAAEFTASVNKNPVSEGERFQITFTIEGSGSNFDPPSFRNFRVLSGPSTSQSMQMINGNITRSISYSYVLQADKQGEFEIGPASIVSNGKKLKTNTINMKVVPPTERQKAERQRERQQQQEALELIGDNLFAKLYVNKKNVYQGEQITATLKLFKHPELSMADYEEPKLPSYNGFWTHELTDSRRTQWEYENVNGKRFNSIVIKKVILLPQQTGKLTIEPMEMKTVIRLHVQSKRRSFFDDPFDRSTKDFDNTVRSNRATINVKPLPGGEPESFTGAVGDMEMKAWLDKTKIKANNPVNLKIQISGEGNLKLISPFELDLPSDIEVYDPNIVDDVRVSGSKFTGKKTFEYTLIPRREGRYEIEPIEFTYFDLNKKKYITQTSERFVLNVQKGKPGEETTVISGVDREEVKYLGKDVHFIKDLPQSLQKGRNSLFASGMFYGLGTAPLLLFLVFVFFKRKQDELNRNQALLKNRKANRAAKKHLATAKDFLNSQDQEKFYEEVARALWGYISDKLNIPFSELNKDSAYNALINKKVPTDKADRLMATIDESEFARFAPDKTAGNMQQTYDEAARLITEIEGIVR